MSRRRAQARLQTDAAATRHQPFGASDHVGAMTGLRGDTGKLHILAEIVNKAGLVLRQIIQNSLHGMMLVRFQSSADSTVDISLANPYVFDVYSKT